MQQSLLGDATDTSGGFDWGSLPLAIKDIYLNWTQAEAQRELIRLNVERIQRGLPELPLNLDSIRPGVNIGMSSDVKTLVTVLGVGAIGAVLWAGSRRRR